MMTAYERLQAARAQDRPTSRAYIENLFTEQNCTVTGNTQMTLPSLVVLVIWEIFLSHSSALNVVAICRKESAAISAALCPKAIGKHCAS